MGHKWIPQRRGAPFGGIFASSFGWKGVRRRDLRYTATLSPFVLAAIFAVLCLTTLFSAPAPPPTAMAPPATSPASLLLEAPPSLASTSISAPAPTLRPAEPPTVRGRAASPPPPARAALPAAAALDFSRRAARWYLCFLLFPLFLFLARFFYIYAEQLCALVTAVCLFRRRYCASTAAALIILLILLAYVPCAAAMQSQPGIFVGVAAPPPGAAFTFSAALAMTVTVGSGAGASAPPPVQPPAPAGARQLVKRAHPGQFGAGGKKPYTCPPATSRGSAPSPGRAAGFLLGR